MHSIKSFVHIILSAALIVLCFSCGVSSSSSASSPTSSHSPAADDPTQNYFSFTTAAAENYAQYNNGYKGVAIYYRIYTNASDCTSFYNNSIASVVSGDTARQNLTNAGYKALNGEDTVIASSSTNQNVEIRLFDETSYTKCIKVDGTNIKQPTRNVNGKTFQFSSTEYPRTGDGDFSGSETASGPWYVAAYALSVVQGQSMLNEHSKPKYLGYTKIYY